MSPILANIILDKLDKFIEQYQKEFNSGQSHQQNPEYKRLQRKGIIKEIHERNVPTYLYKDPKFKRMRYVRYAGDFLIGVIGSKADCEKIRLDVKEFLDTLLLDLNIEKTKITHARDQLAKYLGTEIRITPPELRPIRKFLRNGKENTMKSNTSVQIYAPMKSILERLEKRRICGKGGRPKT